MKALLEQGTAAIVCKGAFQSYTTVPPKPTIQSFKALF